MLCCLSSLVGAATSPWLLVPFVTLITFYLYCTWHFRHWSDMGVPFLTPQPFFGNVKERLLFRLSFSEMHELIYRQLDPHPIGGFFEGRKPMLLLRDPELIRTVMVRDFECFVDRLTMQLRPGSANESSLLFLKGSRWKEVRSLSTPIFSSGKLRSLLQHIAKCADQMTESLIASPKKAKDLEMKDFFGRFTLDVIAATVFGIESNSLANPEAEFFRVVSRFNKLSLSQRLAIFFGLVVLNSRRVARLLGVHFMDKDTSAFLTELVLRSKRFRQEQAKTAKENGTPAPRHVDFLQLMLDAQAGHEGLKDKDLQKDEAKVRDDDRFERDAILKGHNKKTPPSALTDEVVIGQSLVFLFAGFETSSTMLAFATYELALNPEIQTRARSEVQAAFARHPLDRYQALSEMSYLDNILHETLRKHPPVARVERICTTDEYTLPGTNARLQRGDVVAIPIRGLHWDPKYYPEPERFDPDRFLPENKEQRSPYVFLPFGSGPRNCIGMRFAMMSSKMALAKLLSEFKFTPNAKTEIPCGISKASVFLTSANGLYLNISPINDQ